jgi:uncharacterized membrane protein YgdD (TMEM256/DUF423 family)
MDRWLVAAGSLLGGSGVALGAFAAHALRARLSAERLVTFETGVRYQMYHALALLALAWAVANWPERGLAPAGWLMVAGTVLFSGSLYLLAVTGTRWIGLVTPAGGVLMIAGWGVAAWRTLTSG